MEFTTHQPPKPTPRCAFMEESQHSEVIQAARIMQLTIGEIATGQNEIAIDQNKESE